MPVEAHAPLSAQRGWRARPEYAVASDGVAPPLFKIVLRDAERIEIDVLQPDTVIERGQHQGTDNAMP